MSPALAQREVALAGVALAAAVVALAVTSPHGSNRGGHLNPVYVPGGGWYTALAGARPVRYGTRTNCGVLLRTKTRGVVDSVLPCNIKLFVSFGRSLEQGQAGERTLEPVCVCIDDAVALDSQPDERYLAVARGIPNDLDHTVRLAAPTRSGASPPRPQGAC